MEREKRSDEVETGKEKKQSMALLLLLLLLTLFVARFVSLQACSALT